jgi:hypothetical protein
MLAISDDGPVGVDIERVPERTPTRALAALALNSMQEFVAREAAGKASGDGLLDHWPAGVTARVIGAPAGYVAAIAAPGHGWRPMLHVGGSARFE